MTLGDDSTLLQLEAERKSNDSKNTRGNWSPNASSSISIPHTRIDSFTSMLTDKVFGQDAVLKLQLKEAQIEVLIPRVENRQLQPGIICAEVNAGRDTMIREIIELRMESEQMMGELLAEGKAHIGWLERPDHGGKKI